MKESTHAMTRRHAGSLVISAAAALAAVVPGTAQARASTCRSASTASATTIVARDKVAVVFTRDRKPSLPNADLLGCVYGGRVFALKSICCEGEQVSLAGRFLAYSYQGSAIGDETAKIGLYDLRTGKRLGFTKLRPNSEGPDPEIETYSSVRRLAVTSSGAVVWLIEVQDSDGLATGSYELRAADGKTRKERVVDSGKLDPKSMKISRDEKTLTYTKNGAAKSVSLR
jgi:hypothetical protein